MNEDVIPSTAPTVVSTGANIALAAEGMTTTIDASLVTNTTEYRYPSDVLQVPVAAQTFSNANSDIPSDTTAFVAMPGTSHMNVSAQIPLQTVEQQQPGNIMLPSGEEMNCKNTLHSFHSARGNHSIAEIVPARIPEISLLSLPSELQTLEQTVIGTPVTTSNIPPVVGGLVENDTVTGTTTGTASTSNIVPIRANAVEAVTSFPEAEVYVIPNGNDNKSQSSSSTNKLNRIAIGVGIILVLVMGMIIGVTIPKLAQSPSSIPSSPASSSSSSSSSSKPRDDADNEDDYQNSPQMYISEYISQYINNITLSDRYLRLIDDIPSTSSISAEEASLHWLILNSLNDPDWLEFYERNGKDKNENEERELYDAIADLRQHLTLTQKYALLILWFQQKDLVTTEFDESWTKTAGWLRDANVCMWYGITCKDIDLITLLKDEDGTGTIYNNNNSSSSNSSNSSDNDNTSMGPTDSDTLISVVTKIDFTSDDCIYTGDVEVKDPNLFAYVTYNFIVFVDGISFAGTIPNDIGLLTYLSVINFHGNDIYGTVPSSLGLLSNLNSFDVSENSISGSIPESMQYLTLLRHFDISNNNIDGSIPSALAQLSLSRFHATSNSLSGTIPELYWSNISFFDVSYNQLKGTLPMSMQGWTTLSIFLAMNNRFSGTIPPLTNMTAFSIAGNTFTGTIPSSMQSWEYAAYIDLSSNEIHGNVPLPLADSRLLSLAYVNITKNKLNGTIPFSTGLCDSLVFFSCNRNSFHGSIPDGYKSCIQLLNFEISHNKLTGSLPSWIFQSTTLQTFLASDNNFTWTIPRGVNESYLMDFQVQNNMLTGTIPLYMEQWTYLVNFDVSGNEFTGTIPSQLAAGAAFSPTIFLQNNSFIGNVSETLCDLATRIEADCDIYCTCCTNCIRER